MLIVCAEPDLLPSLVAPEGDGGDEADPAIVWDLVSSPVSGDIAVAVEGCVYIVYELDISMYCPLRGQFTMKTSSGCVAFNFIFVEKILVYILSGDQGLSIYREKLSKSI